ncbi:MAG: LAGLIDADG family homing endonuclease [Patescibacteria group bacterium]
MPIAKKVNKDFFKTWSPNMAYVLGFFTADGSMYQTNRGTHFIDFQITDKKLLEDIRDALDSNHKISVRKALDKNRKPRYRLQIGSKEIFRDLSRIGLMQNKSKTVRLPRISKRYLTDFVRGYFDGDGCVHLGRYWRKDRKQWKWQFTVNFTSGSRQFLIDLWGVLGQHTKGGRVGTKTGGYELVFGQHDSIALFYLMYNNASARIFLERKYKTFQKALKILRAGVA